MDPKKYSSLSSSGGVGRYPSNRIELQDGVLRPVPDVQTSENVVVRDGYNTTLQQVGHAENDTAASGNLTLGLDQSITHSQLISQVLEFDEPKTPSAAFRTWHLPDGWTWDQNGGARGQIITVDDFMDGKYSMIKLQRLGKGASGEVDKVRCNGLNLARKKTDINPRITEARRNLREIQIVKRLRHQHIAQLCGLFILDHTLYSFYYPVAEQDLMAYLNQNQYTNPTWASTIIGGFGCLSAALAYAHSMGIKHWDIHGGNVLVLGSVLILHDWGRSRDSLEYKAGQAPQMDPPSISEHRKGKDRSRDMYRLGIVFELMLAHAYHDRARLSVMYGSHVYPPPIFEPPIEPVINRDEFLQNMSSKDSMISKGDLQDLFALMTDDVNPAEDLTVQMVADYLKTRKVFWGYRMMEDDDGEINCATCGACCSDEQQSSISQSAEGEEDESTMSL